ncbi:MAG: hypothetical protein DRN19_03615 [Thermoplasmata archaeon]|nr:MAG: hypothetical protein DRN19_03615 [Thermoplasmata archaeon]
MRSAFAIICLVLLLLNFGAFQSDEHICEKNALEDVKVASLYERISPDSRINRTIDDIVRILNETRTEFIFRAWWRWYPCPENVTDPAFPDEYLGSVAEVGYTYEHLRKASAEIRKNNPNIIICGAVPAQFLFKKEWNPITREILDENATGAMRLDPSKWGIDKELPPNYRGFPDITNPDFRELLLSWAKKQIDCGVDAIWIDMLFKQAKILEGLTGDVYHQAVKESYEAACKVVDEIHEYGNQKGKHIYVGTWAYTPLTFPYPPPKLDFVTASPRVREIKERKLNDTKWEFIINITKEKLGDIPIIAFIDWADTTNTPLGTFSQKLSKEEQREFLKYADGYFRKRTIIFAYPVHGGFMGKDAKILSFGKLRAYDSLAPEFDTYETIAELAKNRARGKPLIGIERPRNYLYVFDKEIAPLKEPIIVGKITVIADAHDEDGIQKVEFYIDGILKYNDTDQPYEWIWDEFAIGKHKVKVIAYDMEGNKAWDEIKVVIFNLGR